MSNAIVRRVLSHEEGDALGDLDETITTRGTTSWSPAAAASDTSAWPR